LRWWGSPAGKYRSIIATVPALPTATSALARAFILYVRGPYYECNGRGYAECSSPGGRLPCHVCSVLTVNKQLFTRTDTRAAQRRHPRWCRRGATLNLGYGGRWQQLRCVDPGRSLGASRVMGAPTHYPLADGSHIGGVAAGVHPVGRVTCAGPTEACGACPHPKATKDPGTRAPWVRPTPPPAAPSGQRAADVRLARSGAPLMLRALGHWKTTVRRTPQSRGMLATWTGGQRGGTPAPRPDRAPPPKKGTRYPTPSKIQLV